MEKAVLKKWLKAGFMQHNVFFPTEAGTPQGGICSPVLANLTLDGLEQAIENINLLLARKGPKAKVHLTRYADDFVLSGPT